MTFTLYPSHVITAVMLVIWALLVYFEHRGRKGGQR